MNLLKIWGIIIFVWIVIVVGFTCLAKISYYVNADKIACQEYWYCNY